MSIDVDSCQRCRKILHHPLLKSSRPLLRFGPANGKIIRDIDCQASCKRISNSPSSAENLRPSRKFLLVGLTALARCGIFSSPQLADLSSEPGKHKNSSYSFQLWRNKTSGQDLEIFPQTLWHCGPVVKLLPEKPPGNEIPLFLLSSN